MNKKKWMISAIFNNWLLKSNFHIQNQPNRHASSLVNSFLTSNSIKSRPELPGAMDIYMRPNKTTPLKYLGHGIVETKKARYWCQKMNCSIYLAENGSKSYIQYVEIVFWMDHCGQSFLECALFRFFEARIYILFLNHTRDQI